jgi:hypothetical protein
MVFNLLLALLLVAGIFPRTVALGLAGLAFWHYMHFSQVITGYEAYLPWMLLLSLLLPLNGRAAANPLAVWVYTLWLGGTYWTAGWGKSDYGWRDGNALAGYLVPSPFTKPVGEWVGQFPGALRPVSIALPFLEISVVILLLIAVFRPRFRGGLVAAAIVFHFGILLMLRVDDISYCALVSWLPFLPAAFWEKVRIFSRAGGVQKFNGTQKAGAVILIFLAAWFYVTPFGVKVPHLMARVGLWPAFTHFSRGSPDYGWVRVLGARKNDEPDPAKWLEIRVPQQKLFSLTHSRRPENLYHDYFGGSRYWQKFFLMLDRTSRDSEWCEFTFRKYLCEHYGPKTRHQISYFEWNSMRMQGPEAVEWRRLGRTNCPD